MISYEDIRKANSECKASPIKDKPYIEVNERIKAFRKVYPDGFITTEMVSNENGVCIFKTEVGYYSETGEKRVLATGMAYEKEGSTFINKTSYIENCETSSCGRALGIAGFGIDASIASFEEVSNAIAQQDDLKEQTKTENKSESEKKATPKQIEYLKEVYKGENLGKLLKANGLEKIEDMSISKASELISKIKKGEKKA